MKTQITSNTEYTPQQGSVKPLTWDELATIEPRLQALYEEIRQVRAVEKSFCANDRWYGAGDYHGRGFKQRLYKLVGDGRVKRDPKLMAEWEAAADRLKAQSPYGLIRLGDLPMLPPACGCDGPDILCTSEAYDVAYQTLYELLPNCRACGCL